MFILTKDLALVADAAAAWKGYESYLLSLKGRLPSETYEFAIADWHYDPRDRRCPHDAWVENFELAEISSGPRSEIRSLQLTVTLLGAYHDGNIKIEYRDVASCNVATKGGKHGDWLYDEVRISDCGLVIHEVELQNSHWMIECKSIEYRWLPFVPGSR